ncbi:WASH complex subunit 5 [Chrysoperla carnea]|uniref:WASH complex subunit 5 n=1 Tax=Chrysoperla carnea TaxID=189513 RepID=UPI001D05F937|nr:WASH complex subunit 5 [Chrysoperla carnea]
MAEFLSENNLCGQNILRLVSRGNAIIAELLRLKNYIPPVFKLQTKFEQQKYGDIILDFKYLKSSDYYDKKIEEDPVLQELDEQFRENYLPTVRRFYLVFENIHTYVCDLNHFLEELEDGFYMQQSLETVLLDFEGKQLLCEVLYLYGVMLLIVDLHIEGIVRERLLISYLRYSGQRNNSSSNVDDVCKLLRSTGFVSNPTSGKRPANYPENYFSRIKIDPVFIDIVIGRLRNDDIYGQIATYQLPEHRNTALANQAAMLYVCLFFAPNILHSHTTKMREIVDKFFPDNWIISIYMGITVNLIDSWECYKAAKNALSNTLDSSNVKEHASRYGEKLNKLIIETKNVLKEGALTEEILIHNVHKIINLVRECNVTIRWLMLHTSNTSLQFEFSKKSKQTSDQICSDSNYEPLKLFELLLNTSQFELKIKEMFKNLLLLKDEKWENCKKESIDRILELADVFSGSKPLTRIEKNTNLQTWFTDIAKHIENLENHDVRKIVQLIQALEEVQEFHQLDTNLQVKQFLADTRKFLHQMYRTVNIKEDVLIKLQIISDLSYAWNIIDNYTIIMQKGIKNDPSLVIKLRALFMKLASALEIPLLRINQAHSEDMVSVSQYYSNDLVLYVKTVLQIIPETMFGIMARIINLQTNEIKELPTRLDKDKMKDYAQYDERFEVAKLTHSIFVFTEGMLMMDTTLVGVISIEPRRLLEDGIRRELIKNVSQAFHNNLMFNPKSKGTELETKLATLAEIIDGYRRSFEYIQDYVNINGLKIWHEEISRLMSYAVEQECLLITQGCYFQDWVMNFGDFTNEYNIVLSPSTDTNSANFMGSLAREIEKFVNPRNTIYLNSTVSWYDYKTRKEIVNLKFFSNLLKSMAPCGLAGLSRIYSFLIYIELQKCMGLFQNLILKDKVLVGLLENVKNDLENKLNPAKFITNYSIIVSKIGVQLHNHILRIGSLQLLRKHIAYELHTSSKFDSKDLELTFSALNDSLLADIKAHFEDPDKNKYPNEDFLFEIANLLEGIGLHNPLEKIYLTTKNIEHISTILFLFVISQLPKLTYVKNIDGIVAKKIDQTDGIPFLIGTQTILKQFRFSITEQFIEYISKYYLINIENFLKIKTGEMNPDTVVLHSFIENYFYYASDAKEISKKFIPQPILDQFNFLVTKVA